MFTEPDRYDPVGNAAANLVYGIGPHVCPGRPLATLELRVLTRVLLDRTRWEPAAEPPEREQPPLGGSPGYRCGCNGADPASPVDVREIPVASARAAW